MKIAIAGGETIELDGAQTDLTLELTTDDDAATSCAHCSEEIAEYAGTGWVHDVTSNRQCGPWHNSEMRADLDGDDEDEEHLTDEEVARLEEQGRTFATPGPGPIANWAGITVEPDYVEVQISVGDPRGCFTMKLWRGTHQDKPVLYLTTPYPGETTPHVATVRHTDGTLRLVP